jgi:hypothetical protein
MEEEKEKEEVQQEPRYKCWTCGLPVDPNNCWYRLGFYFHSPECRDLFDERNDEGHLR